MLTVGWQRRRAHALHRVGVDASSTASGSGGGAFLKARVAGIGPVRLSPCACYATSARFPRWWDHQRGVRTSLSGGGRVAHRRGEHRAALHRGPGRTAHNVGGIVPATAARKDRRPKRARCPHTSPSSDPSGGRSRSRRRTCARRAPWRRSRRAACRPARSISCAARRMIVRDRPAHALFCTADRAALAMRAPWCGARLSA
jgi:hypothetical protein